MKAIVSLLCVGSFISATQLAPVMQIENATNKNVFYAVSDDNSMKSIVDMAHNLKKIKPHDTSMLDEGQVNPSETILMIVHSEKKIGKKDSFDMYKFLPKLERKRTRSGAKKSQPHNVYVRIVSGEENGLAVEPTHDPYAQEQNGSNALKNNIQQARIKKSTMKASNLPKRSKL